MLTCQPNSLLAEVHTRMPVILRPEQYSAYLDTPAEQVEDLIDILLPYPAEEMHGNFDRESS